VFLGYFLHSGLFKDPDPLTLAFVAGLSFSIGMCGSMPNIGDVVDLKPNRSLQKRPLTVISSPCCPSCHSPEPLDRDEAHGSNWGSYSGVSFIHILYYMIFSNCGKEADS